MSSIVVAGDTSGSVTLQAPAVAGTTVITLPATSGTMITTASSGQSIPKAALPTGSVLQVVQGVSSTFATSVSTSFVATGVSQAITPTSATSKVLVTIQSYVGAFVGSAQTLGLAIYRGATQVYVSSGTYNGTTVQGNSACLVFLDSPATTSSTTYSLYFKINASGATAIINPDSVSSTSVTLMEIAA